MKQYYRSAYKFSVLVLTIIFVAAAMGYVLSSKVANAAWEDPNMPNVPPSPVVLLKSYEHDMVGSGVVISQKITPNFCIEYVLTADHVVPSGNGQVDFSDGKHIVVTVKRNPMWDLHLLKVLTRGKCLAPMAMTINTRPIPWGTYIDAVGYADGKGPMRTEGFFIAYNQLKFGPMKPPLALYSIAVFPGMSGGAFMKDGMLVGIITNTSTTHINNVVVHSDWAAGPAAWLLVQFLRGTPVSSTTKG